MSRFHILSIGFTGIVALAILKSAGIYGTEETLLGLSLFGLTSTQLIGIGIFTAVIGLLTYLLS
jgi:hypothetical protein